MEACTNASRGRHTNARGRSPAARAWRAARLLGALFVVGLLLAPALPASTPPASPPLGGQDGSPGLAPDAADGSTVVGLSWQTPWGPGSADVPALPEAEPADACTTSITRVRGALLSDGGADLILLGEHVAGDPALDPEDLLDALAVSARALASGQDPSVSIDPTAEQLERHLTDDDTLQVVYFGGLRNTYLGDVCYESDRLLKCLSLGKDNLSGQPFPCPVAGHRDELELVAAQPDSNRDTSIHRFWIEPLRSVARRSADGRAYFLDSTLRVKTQYMVAGGGKLQPTEAAPDASARAFCREMTERFDDYAAVYPSLRRLQAFARMTVLASSLLDEAAHDPRGDGPAARLLSELRGRVPRHVETAAVTPAAAVSRSDTVVTREDTPESTVFHYQVAQYRLAGGVSLLPKVQNAPLDGGSAVIAERAAESLARVPRARAVAFETAGHDWVARATRPAGPAFLRARQTDLTAGPLAVTRAYPVGDGPSTFSDWSLAVPRLRVAAEQVEYEGLGQMPAYVEVVDEAGKTVVLSQGGTLLMPGQSDCPGLFAGGRGEEALYCFPNVWIYTEDGVQYRSLGGGPVEMVVPEGARVFEFGAASPHAVLKVRTASGTVSFETTGGRVDRISDVRGDEVRFAYDEAGRCREVRATAGPGAAEEVRRYRYDDKGRLLAVEDQAGLGLTLDHGRSSGRVTGIGWDDPAGSPALLPSAPGLPLRRRRSWGDLLRGAAGIAGEKTGVVCLRQALQGGNDEYEIAVSGLPAPAALPLERHVEAILAEEDAAGRHADVLRRLLIEPAEARGWEQLVLLGEPAQVREGLALALRRLWPRGSVGTASDPARARENLSRPSRLAPARLAMVSEGLHSEILASLADVPSAAENSPVVAIIGHSCRQYAEAIDRLGRSGQLAGKTVFLLTCGTAEAPGLRETVLSYGAVAVFGFDQPIEARLLVPLARGLQAHLESAGKAASPPAPDALFRDVVQEVETLPVSPKAPGGPKAGEGSDQGAGKDALKLFLRQIGRAAGTASPPCGLASPPNVGTCC